MSDDMDSLDYAALLAMNAYTMHSLALSAPSIQGQRFLAFIRNPIPGCLVFEISSGLRALHMGRKDAVFKALGYLEEIKQEPWDTEEWDEVKEGRPCPTEQVVYIKNLDGTPQRWTNCEFVRVIEHCKDYLELVS